MFAKLSYFWDRFKHWARKKGTEPFLFDLFGLEHLTPLVDFSNKGLKPRSQLLPSLSPHSTVSSTTLQGRYSAYSECRGDKELTIILYSVCQSL